MQVFGIAALATLIPPLFWAWRLLTQRNLPRPAMRLLLLLLGTVCASGVAAVLPVTAHWPLPTGLGGVLGDAVMAVPRRLLSAVKPALLAVAAALALGALLLLSASVGLRERLPLDLDEEDDEPVRPRAAARASRDYDDDDADGEPGLGLLSLGAADPRRAEPQGRAEAAPAPARRAAASRPRRSGARDPGFEGRSFGERDFDVPFDLSFAAEPTLPQPSAEPSFDASAYAPPALRAAAREKADSRSEPAAPPLPGSSPRPRRRSRARAPCARVPPAPSGLRRAFGRCRRSAC